MRLTALHDEGVGLTALHVQLGDELVVDPPGDAPAGVPGDGAVPALAAGRPYAHGQLTVPQDSLGLPRLDGVLVRQVKQRAGTGVVVLGAEVDADVVWNGQSKVTECDKYGVHSLSKARGRRGKTSLSHRIFIVQFEG